MGVHYKENEEKITLWMIIIGIGVISVLATILIVYLINSSLNKDSVIEKQIVGDVESIKEYDDNDDYEAVSIDIGKTVQEQTNQDEENKISKENTVISEKKVNDNVDKEEYKIDTTKLEETNENIELNFIAPIKGEIIREFAPDSLVYSQTLEEWVTHNGIDIKADKTSVVTAAADGEVYAIKSDPRYGITVIVNHANGYQTVYANLLTAEYVVEGEKITEGQTIGTIGNSANFEIADDYHLHFEVLQNGDYVDPGILMDF